MINETIVRNRPSISEVIVVEGKDDESAVRKAVDAYIITTHGFGIRQEVWTLIDKAYREKGIIVFTDPDFSGEEIRKRITARCPNAMHAFLPREDALKDGDIGVENATPEAIVAALEKVKRPKNTQLPENSAPSMTMDDMADLGLTGAPGASERRAAVAAILGIGYGNGRTFVRKCNAFGIDREALNQALQKIGEH